MESVKKVFCSIFLFLFLPVPVFAVDRHVTADGNGEQDGTSQANAWSQANFEALNGTGYAGDTFYFHPDDGNFDTMLNVNISGTAGNLVTLDGWEGGTCTDAQREGAGCAGRAIVDNNQAPAASGIFVENQEYLIIQDFEITDNDASGIAINSSATGAPNNITVRYCHIHDNNIRGIWVYRSGEEDEPNYITIESNYIHDHGASGEADGMDIDLVNAWDVVIRNNILYGGAGANECGVDGIQTQNSHRILIEYNKIYSHNTQTGCLEGEDGIDLKIATEEVIIRYNDIWDHDRYGNIQIQSGSDEIYIYGNRIRDSAGLSGIYITRGYYPGSLGDNDMDHIYIWSNLIYDNTGGGVHQNDYKGTGNYGTTTITVINNSFEGNGSAGANAGVSLEHGTNHIIKNNIFQDNASTSGAYIQTRIEDDTTGTYDYNTYYTTGTSGEDIVDTDGEIINLGEWQLLPQDVNGDESNPGFNDAANDDFTLDGTNVDDGIDLSQCFDVTIQGTLYNICIDDALDPDNTVWTTTPPAVATVKRDVYDWDRGAYADLGAATPPVLSTAVIASNGTTLTLAFDTDAYDGAAYSDAHWDVDCDVSGDDVALTYVEGKDTSTWTFTLGSTIASGETCNIDFDGTANSVENSVGDDMAAIVSDPVTNNSTYGAGAVAFGSVGSGSQSLSVPGNQTITVGP